MPCQSFELYPDVAINYKGVVVLYQYKNDDVESGRLFYHFKALFDNYSKFDLDFDIREFDLPSNLNPDKDSDLLPILRYLIDEGVLQDESDFTADSDDSPHYHTPYLTTCPFCHTPDQIQIYSCTFSASEGPLLTAFGYNLAPEDDVPDDSVLVTCRNCQAIFSLNVLRNPE